MTEMQVWVPMLSIQISGAMYRRLRDHLAGPVPIKVGEARSVRLMVERRWLHYGHHAQHRPHKSFLSLRGRQILNSIDDWIDGKADQPTKQRAPSSVETSTCATSKPPALSSPQSAASSSWPR